MSRSRNIKPGFFENEFLAQCHPLARILFVGLWCEADREGRLEDRPMRIKAKCLPYDDCDCDALLNELSSRGFIVRYEVGGARFIAIAAFAKHQNPHIRELPSVIPAPNAASPVPSSDQAQPRQCLESDEHGTGPADSLLLIPDSLNTPIVPKGDSDADAVLSAYHSILPSCKHVSVLNGKRRKRIAAAVKLARSVCRDQGWPYEALNFWNAYFTECSKDRWMRGEVPNPNNPNWRQNLDCLIAEDRFADVMDRAIESLRRAS